MEIVLPICPYDRIVHFEMFTERMLDPRYLGLLCTSFSRQYTSETAKTTETAAKKLTT